jgi:hypothetical protein
VFLTPGVPTVLHAANNATNASATMRVTRRDILSNSKKPALHQNVSLKLKRANLNSVNDSHVSNIAYKMHLCFAPLHLIR